MLVQDSFSTRANKCARCDAREYTHAWPRASHLFTYVFVARR